MTKIEWTERVWNPVRGCSRVSGGCRHCYAMRQAHRFGGPGQPYEGLTKMVPGKGPTWTGEVRCVPEMLDAPLHWRKPVRVFVNSMSDLFHPDVPFEFIDRVFAVMALCPQHCFQVLTKRPERMREYVGADDAYRQVNKAVDAMVELDSRLGRVAYHYVSYRYPWPLPNVWLGVSVEDQPTADERVPLLLDTPAAVRFVSAEPLLGPVDVTGGPWWDWRYTYGYWKAAFPNAGPPLDWILIGGESGHGARPCNVEWIRDIVSQCREAGVACFVKQLGASPYHGYNYGDPLVLRSRKGSDPNEWPVDLRVRQYPEESGR